MESEKIVFVIQSLGRGGAELFLLSLANNLQEKGLQPIIIILSNNTYSINELDINIKTYVLVRRFRYDFFISNQIRKIILIEKAKKIFCIGAFTLFLSKLSLLQYPDLKFYLSLHSTIPFSHKEYLLEMIYLRFLKTSDNVIFICHNQKSYYQQKYLFQFNNSNVIYNGIDSKAYSSLLFNEIEFINKKIRKELNIPIQSKVIIKVANIRKEKGHFYAVDALKILHGIYDIEAHLIFVGDGPEVYLNLLKGYVNKSNLADYIHFVGPKDDVRPYLAAADIFTLTSYSVETLSIAAMEAMSFGLPCCLTEIGGASEIVEENRTGLLCTPKNTSSIAKAWNSLLISEYDKDYIKYTVYNKFSFETMANQYFSVLVN